MNVLRPLPRLRRFAAAFSTQALVPYQFDKLYTTNHLGLPRLPVPALSDTIERYLDSVRPLVNANEYNEHERLVRDFQQTSAERIHQLLLEIDSKDAASGDYPYYYFESVWDEGYLATRDPIPINTNPALAFNMTPGEMDQLTVSAKFLNAFAKWVHKLRSGQMAPDGPNADMSQYFFQVGTGRVPKVGRDIPVADHQSRHVVVIHRDRCFQMDVIDAQGQHISAPALKQTLRDIQRSKATPSIVGRLTAANRDVWAVNREKLEKASPANQAALKSIDTALLVLVLEDAEPASTSESLPLLLMGVESRWYDKHQLIVTRNGLVGLNLEHAFGDGMTWLRWMSEVWAAVQGDASALPTVPETPVAPPEQFLEWQVPGDVQFAAIDADIEFRKAVKNCDVKTLSLSEISRSQMKERKMAPDATAQLAMHLAHQRLHGYMAPTYESCSTRSYFHGRTETIRSATWEAQQFALAMLDQDSTPATRWGLYQAAAAKHTRLAREAALGQGVDRHLMMLRILGQQQPDPHPLFADPLFTRSRTWRLSTSNLSVPVVGGFCFGAVVPHGYGIGYAIQPSTMSFAVSSFADNRTTDTSAYCFSLECSVREIVALSEQVSKL